MSLLRPLDSGPTAPPASATPEGAPLRLLVVDDDELDRLSVRRFALAAGFRAEVTECADAEAALAALETGAFDCVFLDFNLPTRDGLWVLRSLRERNDGTPVIVLTGQGEPEVAVELMKSGATDYLAKASLDADRLGRSLRAALRLRRAEEEARAAQEALRASEELNRRVIAASADCFKLLDLDGRLLFMSEAGARAHGISDVDALLGRSWADLYQGEDRDQARGALEKARGGQPARFVGHGFGTEGRPTWWDVVVTPVPGPTGRPERILAVARDVTEVKQKESFEQQLVGIVSHDLRNPLNAILLGAELLLRRDELDERTIKSISRIRAAADRAGRMIRDLLDFTQARLGGGIPITRTEVDLAVLAAHVVEETGLAWPLREVRLEAVSCLVGRWDGDRLSQVLTNLLSNALQYSPQGTPVICRVREDGEWGVLEVHNQGSAIPPEQQARIFEPLQRATGGGDNTARSIGLGLYIVKQLVLAHRGEIALRSLPDEGTTFTLRLPRG